MTSDTPESGEWSIDRRTVLKSVGAASIAGMVGVPAFTGSALADSHTSTTEFTMYAVEHNSHDGEDRPDRLLGIDAASLTAGDITAPISVQTWDLFTDDPDPQATKLNTATLAASPDGYLYGLHRAGAAEADGSRSDSQAFRITIPDATDTTATVEFLGSSNPELHDIWASAFDANGDWFGVDSGSDTLYQIDPTSGSTTAIGGLTVGESGYDSVHVGMGVNFQTGGLWLVSGNKSTGKSDIFEIDTTTGALTLATNGEDALTAGRLVGGAFGPCADVLYVVRNRNDLYGFDVGTGNELQFGSLEYTLGGEVVVDVGIDNLAVPFGIECVQCAPCETEGLLAKYEFDCVDTVEDECVAWDFVFEKGDDSLVTYEPGSFTSKDDEMFEPMTATFGTDYCTVYAVVKTGQGLDVQELIASEGQVTAEAPDKYAISFVAFYCDEEAASEAAESFPSNGRGRGDGD